MYDKLKALEPLGKHLGMFQKNINVKLNADELTPEEAEALIRAYANG